MNLPAIVVVCYNRPNSLRRLLESIRTALFDFYPHLIISIDYHVNHQIELERIANSFEWQGQKSILIRNENLGLKKHVFECAGLSSKYSSVIILEDDLIVSPGFYKYACNSLKKILLVKKIAGISLYNNSFDETSYLPFYPLKTDGDYYLMQVPCSWGQLWTAEQWNCFKEWHEKGFNQINIARLPVAIQKWSDKSWKKPFFLYLLEKNKYFLYPYISYTMNLGEIGEHVELKSSKFLNSLSFESFPKEPELSPDCPYYSNNYTISPIYICEHASFFKDKKFIVDFFGTMLHNLNADDWVLTCLPAKAAEISFGLELKPIELNIIYNMKGKDIKFVQKRNITSTIIPKKIFEYYYPISEWQYSYFQIPMQKRIQDIFLFMIKRRLKIFTKSQSK